MSKRGPKLGRDTQAKKHCFKENKKQKSFHKFSQSQERKTKPFQDNTTHKPVCGIKASFVTRIYTLFSFVRLVNQLAFEKHSHPHSRVRSSLHYAKKKFPFFSFSCIIPKNDVLARFNL